MTLFLKKTLANIQAIVWKKKGNTFCELSIYIYGVSHHCWRKRGTWEETTRGQKKKKKKIVVLAFARPRRKGRSDKLTDRSTLLYVFMYVKKKVIAICEWMFFSFAFLVIVKNSPMDLYASSHLSFSVAVNKIFRSYICLLPLFYTFFIS